MKRFFIGTALFALFSLGSANADTFIFSDFDVDSGETDLFRITITQSAVPGLDPLVGALTYDLFALPGSSDVPDTIMTLLTDDGSRTVIAENDDANSADPSDLTSSLSLFLDPGTYLLAVSGFNNFYGSPNPASAATGYSLAIFNDVSEAEYLGSEFAPIPLPAAVWLFLSGLIPTLLVRRRSA